MEKITIELIQKFHDLENLYAKIEQSDFREKVKQLLLAQKKEACLSKKLVTIQTNLKTNFKLEETALQGFEIKKVADFIKERNKNLEEGEELNFEENGNNGGGLLENYLEGSGEEDDELYEEALEAVKAAQKASASLLQRRLKIGYARAARLLDIMEEKGIIGPGEGAKPREVYIK